MNVETFEKITQKAHVGQRETVDEVGSIGIFMIDSPSAIFYYFVIDLPYLLDQVTITLQGYDPNNKEVTYDCAANGNPLPSGQMNTFFIAFTGQVQLSGNELTSVVINTPSGQKKGTVTNLPIRGQKAVPVGEMRPLIIKSKTQQGQYLVVGFVKLKSDSISSTLTVNGKHLNFDPPPHGSDVDVQACLVSGNNEYDEIGVPGHSFVPLDYSSFEEI